MRTEVSCKEGEGVCGTTGGFTISVNTVLTSLVGSNILRLWANSMCMHTLKTLKIMYIGI